MYDIEPILLFSILMSGCIILARSISFAIFSASFIHIYYRLFVFKTGKQKLKDYRFGYILLQITVFKLENILLELLNVISIANYHPQNRKSEYLHRSVAIFPQCVRNLDIHGVHY